MDKRQEEEKRRLQIKTMVETPGFIGYLLPYIEKQIEKSNSIKKIDEESIEKSYCKQKTKYDVYKGILNIIERWLKKGE